ncbi:hypothetical protein BD779DRAFT_769284 [Infundibulicybe gibba]|nr:hypothetical protein BD779DRAFT_769284 [Infundibulicybe gibba]
MHMYHPVTSLLLLVLPLATATSAPRSLLRRAVVPSTVPSQCTSACNPLAATVADCEATNNAVACGLCTTKTEQEALQCANCIIALTPATSVISAEQLSINEYIDDCLVLGVVLPPVKVTVPTTTSNTDSTSPSQGASNPTPGGNVNPLGGGGGGLVGGVSSLRTGPLPMVLVGIYVMGHLLTRAGMYI